MTTMTRIKVPEARQSAIGINITDQVYDDGHWNPMADKLYKLNPKSIGILGAAQYYEARQRAAECRLKFPTAFIKFRHMIHQPPGSDQKTDQGMWKLPPQEYVQNVILAHSYHQTGWYIVTDNESSFSTEAGQTWRKYAEKQAQVLDLGVPTGARFAVLRTPTHWPLRSQLDAGELDELFKAIARNMGSYDDPRVILSPNAYYDDGNVDALLKVKALRDRFFKVTGREPVISLGEFGFDRNFTSGNGWRKVGMEGAAYIAGLVGRFNHYVGMHNWTADVYCVGIGEDDKVKQFALGMDELGSLIALKPTWVSVPPKEEAPVENPPEAPQETPVIAVAQKIMALRAEYAGIDAQILALQARRDGIDAQIMEQVSQLMKYVGGMV